MKNTMLHKKLATFLTIIIALTMILGTSLITITPASAALTTTGTITIEPEASGRLAGRSFAAYRIVDYSDVAEDGTPTPAYRGGANSGVYQKAVNDALSAVGLDAKLDSLAGLVGDVGSWGGTSAYQFSIRVYEALTAEGSGVSPDASVTCGEGAECRFAGMQYGYYLIAETGVADAGVSEAGKPSQSYLLLASLDSVDGVRVAAKSVTPVSHKYITQEEGRVLLDESNTPVASRSVNTNSTSVPDYQIGQPIWYTLEYRIPAQYAQDFADHDVKFEYKLQDSLAPGLHFDGNVSLRVSTISVDGRLTEFSGSAYTELTPVAGATLPQGAELSDADGDYNEWDFTVQPASYAGYASLPAYAKMENYLGQSSDIVVYLTYQCHMTDRAVIASTGNVNNFNVTYTTGAYGSMRGRYSHTPQESPRVYTAGAMTIRKSDAEDESVVLSGVQFCLTTTQGLSNAGECAGSAGHVPFTLESNGMYYAADNGVDTLTTDARGEFSLSGLDLKTYYLWETNVGDNTDFALATVPWEFTVRQATESDFEANPAIRNHYFPKGNSDTEILYMVDFSGQESQPMNGTTFGVSDGHVTRDRLPATGALGIGALILLGVVFLGGGTFLTVNKARQATGEDDANSKDKE